MKDILPFRINIIFKLGKNFFVCHCEVNRPDELPPKTVKLSKQYIWDNYSIEVRYEYRLTRKKRLRPNFWLYLASRILPKKNKKEFYDDEE